MLVEDVLTFGTSGTFQQAVSAFPYQTCGAANTLTWAGSYAQQSSFELYLGYSSCSASGAGCLACGAAAPLTAEFKFSSECEVLNIRMPGDSDARTYYAGGRRRATTA